jgi:hypothetical protein
MLNARTHCVDKMQGSFYIKVVGVYNKYCALKD